MLNHAVDDQRLSLLLEFEGDTFDHLVFVLISKLKVFLRFEHPGVINYTSLLEKNWLDIVDPSEL